MRREEEKRFLNSHLLACPTFMSLFGDCDNEFSERVCCNFCSIFLPNHEVQLDARLRSCEWRTYTYGSSYVVCCSELLLLCPLHIVSCANRGEVFSSSLFHRNLDVDFTCTTLLSLSLSHTYSLSHTHRGTKSLGAQ